MSALVLLAVLLLLGLTCGVFWLVLVYLWRDPPQSDVTPYDWEDREEEMRTLSKRAGKEK